MEPSQVRHPWRAVARTAIQVVAALAVAVPLIVSAVEAQSPGLLGVAGTTAVAVALGVTRVMSLPAVNELLTKLGLGPEPRG